jgi:membrane associated rhomboid family serine protease
MIPLSDDNPTLRLPIVTIALLAIIGAVWVLLQGADFDPRLLAASVCNFGLVAGEITRLAPVGTSVPLGDGMACIVDADPVNVITPLTSMFLHGSWAHVLGNGLFLWVFGNNVEDSMGRLRFVFFYLICGLAAAAAQVIAAPASPVPMVGASGAISGVMGAYLVLYPHARVNMLFIIVVIVRIIPVPAWLVLLYWFGLQLLAALPELSGAQKAVEGGVAVMAHVGGFIAGAALVKLFENRRFTEARAYERRRRTRGFF